MQGLFILGRFLVETALLWFIIVWVTQEHDLSWRQVVTWVLIAAVAGLAGFGLCAVTRLLPIGICLLIGMVLQIVTLWVILRRQGFASAKVTTILILFLLVRAALALPRLLG
jgi:hypothetical protein